MEPVAPRPAGGRLAAPVLAGGVRLLAASWRVSFVHREILDETLAAGPAVLAFWHGEQLVMVATHAGRGFLGMASLSRDGELLARVIRRLGYRVVRGSASRGGREALRRCQAALAAGGPPPALALDGPRGPRHEPHAGALVLAARARVPVVFGVSRARPAIRLRSWDRFEIPLPGARVRVAYGRLPPPDPGEIESARAELRRRMERLAAELAGEDGASAPGHPATHPSER